MRGAVGVGEPGRGLVGGLAGRVLAGVYARELARRNKAFDAGRGVTRFDRPVISVGNLSVGGTGKTPMVTRLAGSLVEAGRRPVIAMRGYKGGRAGSDEADVYARTLPGVPVLVNPDRTGALRAHFSGDEGRATDCVLLDDGFQHRRVWRDLDVVLVDASRSPFEDALLPAGWLREPVESLARADVVVLTHAERVGAEEVAALRSRVLGVAGEVGVCVARHAWVSLAVRRPGADEDERVEPAWLAGRRVVCACAIGHPRAFLDEAVRWIGGQPADAMVRRDHDPFERGTVDRLVAMASSAGAEAILVTEKDWAKLRRVDTGVWPCPVVRPALEMSFDEGWEGLWARVMGVVEK